MHKDLYKKRAVLPDSSFLFISLKHIELKKIYEEYTNKEVTKRQLNCNSCWVKIVKELAKDYLEVKEKELKKIKNKKDVDKQTEPKIIND